LAAWDFVFWVSEYVRSTLFAFPLARPVPLHVLSLPRLRCCHFCLLLSSSTAGLSACHCRVIRSFTSFAVSTAPVDSLASVCRAVAETLSPILCPSAQPRLRCPRSVLLSRCRSVPSRCAYAPL